MMIHARFSSLSHFLLQVRKKEEKTKAEQTKSFEGQQHFPRKFKRVCGVDYYSYFVWSGVGVGYCCMRDAMAP